MLIPLLAALLFVGLFMGIWGEGVRLGFKLWREMFPVITVLMEAASDHGFQVLILVYVYLLARGFRDRKLPSGRASIMLALRFAVGAILFGLLLTQLLKAGFGLPRPGFPLPRQPFGFTHAYSSFPSGHTVNIIMAALPLAFWSGRLKVRLALSLLIALVGFSRLWLGAHHPVDVLGGILIGSLAARWIAPAKPAN